MPIKLHPIKLRHCMLWLLILPFASSASEWHITAVPSTSDASRQSKQKSEGLLISNKHSNKHYIKESLFNNSEKMQEVSSSADLTGLKIITDHKGHGYAIDLKDGRASARLLTLNKENDDVRVSGEMFSWQENESPDSIIAYSMDINNILIKLSKAKDSLQVSYLTPIGRQKKLTYSDPVKIDLPAGAKFCDATVDFFNIDYTPYGEAIIFYTYYYQSKYKLAANTVTNVGGIKNGINTIALPEWSNKLDVNACPSLNTIMYNDNKGRKYDYSAAIYLNFNIEDNLKPNHIVTGVEWVPPYIPTEEDIQTLVNGTLSVATLKLIKQAGYFTNHQLFKGIADNLGIVITQAMSIQIPGNEALDKAIISTLGDYTPRETIDYIRPVFLKYLSEINTPPGR